ncbi:MAG: hypothetical protein AAF491_06380, partial [Verrucomicrobiota bacterium]
MSRFPVLFLFVFCSSLFAGASEYTGSVGKMEAVFSLEWRSDGSVSGSYSYPSRAGISYSLSGSNHREGELYLEEFTAGQLSAKCYLRKRLTDSQIIWEGEMHNTDGRRFPMRFARSRGHEGAPADAPLNPHHLGDSRSYSGQVGTVGAEFQLRWQQSGTVSGTYHYPTKPGVTHQLVGSNPREGELHLDEYTNGEMTASCILRKQLTDSQIIWEGIMTLADGSELPLSFVRETGNTMPQTSAPSSNDSFTDEEFSTRIRTSVSWTDFPLANEVVEMVPVFPENAVPMNARVETYSSSEAEGLEIVFRVGLRDESDWDEIRYEGPLVTFRANRHIPLPQDKIVGKEIYLEYLSDGSLFAITLQAISVTHVRTSASSDKLEIRGLLDGEGIAHLHGLSPAAQKDAVEAAGFIALLPDKLALSDWNDTELMFRDLRL